MNKEQLNRALRKLAGDQVPEFAFTGKVDSVDTDAHTCDVLPSDGGAAVYGVRLKAAQSTGKVGLILYPKKGSEVVVMALDKAMRNCVLVRADVLEEVLVRVDGGADLRVKSDGEIYINGSNYGGLVKWDELKQDLDLLKNFQQTITLAIQSAPIVANDGGASFKSSLIAALAPLQVPQFITQTITSDKTRHGG